MVVSSALGLSVPETSGELLDRSITRDEADVEVADISDETRVLSVVETFESSTGERSESSNSDRLGETLAEGTVMRAAGLGCRTGGQNVSRFIKLSEMEVLSIRSRIRVRRLWF